MPPESLAQTLVCLPRSWRQLDELLRPHIYAGHVAYAVAAMLSWQCPGEQASNGARVILSKQCKYCHLTTAEYSLYPPPSSVLISALLQLAPTLAVIRGRADAPAGELLPSSCPPACTASEIAQASRTAQHGSTISAVLCANTAASSCSSADSEYDRLRLVSAFCEPPSGPATHWQSPGIGHYEQDRIFIDPIYL